MELFLQYKATVYMTTTVSTVTVCIVTCGFSSPTHHHESVTYRLGLKFNGTTSHV